MKLKYKKMILLTTMSTMGIGLLTISISHDKTNADEGAYKDSIVQTAMSDETVVESDIFTAGDSAIEGEVTAAPTSTPIPTPTPLPVYDIEDTGYPKITKLIENYYSAKNNRDVDTLKSLLSDPSEADTQEELQQKTEYIDDYRNITVYVKKGYIEGTYVVYAYHEIKFTSINTPAPGLAKFYVITDSSGELKIFSGELDPEVKAYYDERNSDEDVIALINMTEEKSDKAIESDEDLLNFWKNIDEMANGSVKTDDTISEDTTAQGDTN